MIDGWMVLVQHTIHDTSSLVICKLHSCHTLINEIWIRPHILINITKSHFGRSKCFNRCFEVIVEWFIVQENIWILKSAVEPTKQFQSN